MSWDYNRYGNRKNQNVTAGSAPAPQLAISPTTNRITSTGYAYDSSGNLTNDTLYTYTFDAENRIKEVKQGSTVLSTSYYEGSGLRVKKVAGSNTTRYIFSGTKVIAEYLNGSLNKEYIYGGSQLLATLNSSGTPTYHHPDHLSVRVNSDTSGTVVGQQGHYPFGESWYAQSTTTKWQFTTYERDPESSLDYAIFRYDSSRLGRFMTPDPLAGTILNPQSFNRYAYVINDPINLIDPLGLQGIPTGPVPPPTNPFPPYPGDSSMHMDVWERISGFGPPGGAGRREPLHDGAELAPGGGPGGEGPQTPQPGKPKPKSWWEKFKCYAARESCKSGCGLTAGAGTLAKTNKIEKCTKSCDWRYPPGSPAWRKCNSDCFTSPEIKQIDAKVKWAVNECPKQCEEKYKCD